MKYIKTYEQVYKPQIGDYVICIELTEKDEELDNFLSTNLGICKEIKKPHKDRPFALPKIEFENIPNNIRGYFNDSNFRYFDYNEIKKASPEEIEKYKMKQNANKYNI